jgi:DNA-binding NarL/FixJ family response regulator
LSDAETGTVLVTGEAGLRRAGLVSILGPWARERKLRIEAISPADVPAHAVSGKLKLILLSIGSASLNASEPRLMAERVAAAFPAAPCVAVSDRTEEEEAVHAAEIGLSGFLCTKMDTVRVWRVLTFVAEGGTYFPREALLQIPARSRANRPQAGAAEDGGFTQRQLEVVERLRLGHSNKQIAGDLGMQESTVKVHMRRIMQKFGAANRTQAAILAAESAPSGATRNAAEAATLDRPGHAIPKRAVPEKRLLGKHDG